MLIYSFLSKAYLTNLGLILRLRKEDQDYLLLIDPEGWFFLTKYLPEETISNEFIRMIRKMLEGKKIIDIATPYFDRYIRIDFEDDLSLHIEFMRGGNIVLTEKGIVKTDYKLDRKRFKVNSQYTLPTLNKYNPYELNIEDIITELLSSKGNLIASLWKILGIPPEISNEACYELNIDKNLLPKNFEKEKLTILLNKIKVLIDNYLKSSNPIIVLDSNQKYETVLNSDLKIFSKYNKIFFEDFNKAIEEYFLKYKEYKIKLEEMKEKEKVFEKKVKLIEELKSTINSLNEENKKIKEFIDYLNSNYDLYDNIFKKIQEKINNKDWEGVKEIINNELRIKLPINEIDLKSKKIKLSYKETLIYLDLLKNLYENINELYSKIKENKRKINKIENKLIELKETEETKESKVIKLKEITRKYWYENYLWFITTSGILAVAGRDSSQNESLIKKRIEKEDLVFHADIHGSPFLLLKAKGKNVSDKDIFEAAQFVASYSSAWKGGLRAIDVYWVKPEQVSKQAPSGTYLPKGSFMIYGKKNYVKNVPLELAIAVDENKNLIILPSARVEERQKIILVPGIMEKEKVIEKIMKILKEANIEFDEKQAREFLNRNLPKGGFDILKNTFILTKNK
jgi:predicted ribosome quality control (RQC) complex YloA/Tae2 family protein